MTKHYKITKADVKAWKMVEMTRCESCEQMAWQPCGFASHEPCLREELGYSRAAQVLK